MKLKNLLKKCNNQTLDVYLYTYKNNKLTKSKELTYLNKYPFRDLIKNLNYLNSKVDSFGYVSNLAHTEVYLQVTIKE